MILNNIVYGRATWILPLGDSPTGLSLSTKRFALQVLAFQLSAFQNKESMVRKERLELSHLAAPEPKS
ncbi:hypothetical protein J8A11_23970, partial [Vibrio parahaemolyticus]|nr:hypothetical protein [Vibrio parahaemolyticus]